ncbi:hypothetical protein HMPREF1319_0120 [Capnocytophaga ochracea str. Holt 25]|nr:hypothetical protein HMPREF1319_0120 [Capnocytophaga ochracea str. Holt 25]
MPSGFFTEVSKRYLPLPPFRIFCVVLLSSFLQPTVRSAKEHTVKNTFEYIKLVFSYYY